MLAKQDSLSEDSPFSGRISGISEVDSPRPVYNLIVNGDHTYFVASGLVHAWVHNGCGDDPLHHTVPQAFRNEWMAKTGEGFDPIFNQRVPLASEYHFAPEGLHGGSFPSGEYNQWWYEKADSVGGIGNVTIDHIYQWNEEIGGLFGGWNPE